MSDKYIVLSCRKIMSADSIEVQQDGLSLELLLRQAVILGVIMAF